MTTTDVQSANLPKVFKLPDLPVQIISIDNIVKLSVVTKKIQLNGAFEFEVSSSISSHLRCCFTLCQLLCYP